MATLYLYPLKFVYNTFPYNTTINFSINVTNTAM